MTSSDLKSFNYLENGEVTFSIFDTIKSNKVLDPGSYKLSYLPYPESRIKLLLDKDTEESKSHNFPDKKKIDDLFNSYFNKEVRAKIQSLGFYHKIGLLLYGKEGTGKSTILKHYYTKAILEKNALVFHLGEEWLEQTWGFITNVRKVQNNDIIIVLEEFDSHLKFSKTNVAFLKTILDGNMAINNCVFLATTNFIDEIPSAMKDRGSRFKYVLNIEGIQDKIEINSILTFMLKDLFSENQILSFAKSLEGKTLDEIKQFALDKLMDIKTYESKKGNAILGFLRKELIQ